MIRTHRPAPAPTTGQACAGLPAADPYHSPHARPRRPAHNARRDRATPRVDPQYGPNNAAPRQPSPRRRQTPARRPARTRPLFRPHPGMAAQHDHPVASRPTRPGRRRRAAHAQTQTQTQGLNQRRLRHHEPFLICELSVRVRARQGRSQIRRHALQYRPRYARTIHSESLISCRRFCSLSCPAPHAGDRRRIYQEMAHN